MADVKLVRMTAPNGSTVRVSEERAESLLAAGYTTAGSDTKSTAKKSSSSKSKK